MITVAGIEYQELTVGAKRTGVNHPAVGRRSHLGAGAGCDGKTLFYPAGTIGRTVFLQFDAINRDWNLPAQRRKGDRRRQPARIALRGHLWTLIVTASFTRRPGRRIEPLLKLGDQIFEIVHLARQSAGACTLGIERLLAFGLLLLARLDQRGHARAFVAE